MSEEMTNSKPAPPPEKDASRDQFDAAFQRELERRLSILAPEDRDFRPIGEFNGIDYLLMFLFGVLIPILAMTWGWR
jgi:hypothetical protein